MEPIQVAAVLAAVVVLASMLSVELGISVALFELGLGVVLGNVFGLEPDAEWLVFLASFASIVLTFLAGAEVDPDDLRERLGASLTIGVVSFIGPFVVATLVAYELLDWTLKASLIAGTALSTTSLAVIYAVLVETGLNRTRLGKLLMSACFVTDMGTALALSAIFVRPNAWFPVFLVVSVALIVLLPGSRRGSSRATAIASSSRRSSWSLSACSGSWSSPTPPRAMPCCPPSCSGWSWPATTSSTARSRSACASWPLPS